MGTLISLGVGKMEIDWGKNTFFATILKFSNQKT